MRNTTNISLLKNGFTLVELLVVIAIIGVLIALFCLPCKQRGKPPDVCNAPII